MRRTEVPICTYIGAIQRGERNVSFDNIVHVASAFGLSLSQFFDYRKGGHSRRDTPKAELISLLHKRGESEVKLFTGIIAAFDEWKSGE
jgi:transcriptional regulator with XRE-family HTH domain